MESRLSLGRLSILVERYTPPIPAPRRDLEQYTTPGEIAAAIAWDALLRGYLEGSSRILDLGSGTGRLSLALLYAGAGLVVGVEADLRLLRISSEALSTAGFNGRYQPVHYYVSRKAGLPLEKSSVDIIVSNPPFGVWKRGADTVFLRAGFELEPRVFYAILKAGNLDYHSRVAGEYGYRVRLLGRYLFPIPASMMHHRSRIRRVDVDVVAFES